MAHRYAAQESDGAFRWTVETTHVLKRWLDHAPQSEIDTFLALEKAGRIEVTGMFANVTPLYDTGELMESMQLLRTLRNDYGLTIRHAMNCDVNGENWPLVDVLLDAGITGFSMAINTHFGGYPFARPNAFKWEGPSGRTILTWNGWPYDHGWRFGIGRDEKEFATTWWPRIQARLDETGYDLPILMIQSYHPFGDNGSAFEGFVAFIDGWNAADKRPRIRLATPAEWWQALAHHGDRLPVHRGDWTDYWNFGAISSAREQRINRTSRAQLRTADALTGALHAVGLDAHDPWLRGRYQRYRDEAWQNILLWDEHTWGADCSVRGPDADDTAAQWNHKAQFAYQGRSLSLMLQRDALAGLARLIQRTSEDDLLLVNPLPWPRVIGGTVAPWISQIRGGADDTTAGRHFQDRQLLEESQQTNGTVNADELAAKRTVILPRAIPAFGYQVLGQDDLTTYVLGEHVSEEAVVETAHYRLRFDRERGGVLSWWDKRLARELIDPHAGYALGSFVHEEVADRSHPWPRRLLSQMEWDPEAVERRSLWQQDWHARRQTPTRVISHKVYRTPLGTEIVQLLDAPGCDGPLVQRVVLPDHADYVEFRTHFRLGTDDHPQATYLLFPFALPDAVARLDLGGQAMLPGAEQLPGVCRDYFTVQNWVDFSNAHQGVTIATPENPLVQLGDFHFGAHQQEFVLERPMLLGWITNTYWETNFRAHQPGGIQARYRIRPHAGGFDEAAAHQFGLEALHAAPLLQNMGEPSDQREWPQTGSLLQLPSGPIQVLHVKPAQDADGLLVSLLNASDQPETATMASALLTIVTAAACDLFGTHQTSLPVDAGRVTVTIPARRTATLFLGLAPGAAGGENK